MATVATTTLPHSYVISQISRQNRCLHFLMVYNRKPLMSQRVPIPVAMPDMVAAWISIDWARRLGWRNLKTGVVILAEETIESIFSFQEDDLSNHSLSALPNTGINSTNGAQLENQRHQPLIHPQPFPFVSTT
ncbi:hypothetical protein HAX54_042687 [Datura stramonium]|uniref:Uncharacterized protein n=1 Tax=Datura stramonium TaxID=4076 RepID=A0ABS8W2U5_DATST|nr:hypothetical protein [Datura stramonium]